MRKPSAILAGLVVALLLTMSGLVASTKTRESEPGIHQGLASAPVEELPNPSNATKITVGTSVPARELTDPGPSLVTVDGYRLIVRRRDPDGTLGPASPYVIRGVVWSPASQGTDTSPSDPNNADIRRPEFGYWYQTDIPLFKGMNVNTVRILIDLGFDIGLGPVGTAVLDSCYANDIMVIMTVDDAISDTTRVRQAVEYYRDHPAVLLWSLGSEWNINRYFGVASSVLDAAERTETAAALIKALDDYHPVVSSYGEIDIDADGLRLSDTQNYVNNICPSVDIWSLNVYRGRTFNRLFDQWASISTKPIFLGEFGVDAWHTTILSTPDSGMVDELEQAEWDLSLWKHILTNLSSDTAGVALGGTVFAWNDEWWKVPPSGSQETGGWTSCGFPDRMGNEEYFGLVDIDRAPRQVYDSLAVAFEPGYVPHHDKISFQATSAGALVPETSWHYGFAEFRKNNCPFYYERGGGGAGRGFNIAVIDTSNGEVIYAVRNFDTWYHRSNGTEMYNMINYLNSIPAGRLILIAVADEAGLNIDNSCDNLSYPWVEDGLQALEALGSNRIRDYCFRYSWAMIAVKGEGAARAEEIAQSTKVTVDVELTVELLSVTSGILDRTPFSGNLKVSSWPNPFNPVTTIGYSLLKSGVVNLRIYDVKGRLVQTLVNEAKTAGQHTITWDGRDARGVGMASGVYFVRLEYGGQVEAWKIVLLK